jgi:ribosome-associated protein
MSETAFEEAADKARVVAAAIESKQGHDVVAFEVGDIISITEVFVIAHGTNARQVRTIVDEVERKLLAETGSKPRAREGLEDGDWVLLDYGDVVVHVFMAETREHYALERLWADAPRLDLSSAGRVATA